MQIGLLTLGDLITDPVTGERKTHAQRHRNLVDQAVLAEQCGFASVHLGEHHFCDYILASPAVMLAAIAERTSTLRLSTGVTLAVNNEPLRVAEDYATVDLLSGGRVEPVVGRGTLFPHTFRAFGQDMSTSKAVYAEHLEILVRVWESEDVTWHGEHHAPLEGLTVMPRPLQTPPPIWVGAGLSPDSVQLAARLGLRLLLPTVFGTMEMFRPVVDAYLEAWDRYGHDPAKRRIGCCNHFFVHRDAASARRIWEPRYRAYTETVQQLAKLSTQGASQGFPPFDLDDLLTKTAICGSPAQVVDRMGQMRDLLSLDTQLVMLDMGGIPDADLFTALELVGSDVIPQLAP